MLIFFILKGYNFLTITVVFKSQYYLNKFCSNKDTSSFIRK